MATLLIHWAVATWSLPVCLRQMGSPPPRPPHPPPFIPPSLHKGWWRGGKGRSRIPPPIRDGGERGNPWGGCIPFARFAGDGDAHRALLGWGGRDPVLAPASFFYLSSKEKEGGRCM
nr:hypothetical protein [Morchella crassipes]